MGALYMPSTARSTPRRCAAPNARGRSRPHHGDSAASSSVMTIQSSAPPPPRRSRKWRSGDSACSRSPQASDNGGRYPRTARCRNVRRSPPSTSDDRQWRRELEIRHQPTWERSCCDVRHSQVKSPPCPQSLAFCAHGPSSQTWGSTFSSWIRAWGSVIHHTMVTKASVMVLTSHPRTPHRVMVELHAIRKISHLSID